MYQHTPVSPAPSSSSPCRVLPRQRPPTQMGSASLQGPAGPATHLCVPDEPALLLLSSRLLSFFSATHAPGSPLRLPYVLLQSPGAAQGSFRAGAVSRVLLTALLRSSRLPVPSTRSKPTIHLSQTVHRPSLCCTGDPLGLSTHAEIHAQARHLLTAAKAWSGLPSHPHQASSAIPTPFRRCPAPSSGHTPDCPRARPL